MFKNEVSAFFLAVGKCFEVDSECVMSLETSGTKIVRTQKQRKKKNSNNRKRDAYINTGAALCDITGHLVAPAVISQSHDMLFHHQSSFVYWQTLDQHGGPHTGCSCSSRVSNIHLLPGGVRRHTPLIPTFNQHHLLLHPQCCLPAQPPRLGGDI